MFIEPRKKKKSNLKKKKERWGKRGRGEGAEGES
jgi:hypothetical protein